MSSPASDRQIALAASEGTCPRCGTPREPDQRYCLECGLALPQVSGRVARLRRGWITRIGWYPGDWVWVSLLTLLVAIAGASTAIAVTQTNAAQGRTFAVAVPSVSVQEPTVTPPTATAPATVDTSTLPAAPEPGTRTKKKPARHGPKNGALTWPAGANGGWTIVLVSYPKTTGEAAARSTAAHAAKAGLNQVGLLDSSRYASLQPGYFVVFTGVYGSKSDADSAVSTARQAGFGGAYSRQIAR